MPRNSDKDIPGSFEQVRVFDIELTVLGALHILLGARHTERKIADG